MMNPNAARLAMPSIFLLALMTAFLTCPAAAEERPAPAGEVAAGTLVFADDGSPKEGFVGGGARFYVSPRVSVGPEIAHVRGDNHSHLMLTGNVTFDLLRPVNGQPRRVTPFAVAGGGIFQTRESFPNGIFTSADGAFTAGGGIRAWLGRRVFAGAEARIGWELHVRLNGMVGVRLGR